MLSVWLAVALLGGTTLAAPPYAASIRAPQIELDLDLESPHSSDVSAVLETRQTQGTYRFDFKWVKRWAAIGDSYTAGIGAGSKLGSLIRNTEDYWCSRYTHAWPLLMSKWLGGNRDFQFKACSGARSTDIYEQAGSLSGNLDLVVMTAGGNDLCLNSLIRTCVVTAYYGEEACNEVIAAAERNLRTIVKTNLRYILDELLPKMADDSMVMILGYAPFFDETNEACTNQDWTVPVYWSVRYITGTGLRLTTARRAKFNQLVGKINDVLKEIVDEYSVDPRADTINVRFVDWSTWPAAVGGEMCHHWGDGSYPEPNQPNLLFFKPNTKPAPDHDGLRRRGGSANIRTPASMSTTGAALTLGDTTLDSTTDEDDNVDDVDGITAAATDREIDLSPEAYSDSALNESPNPSAMALKKLNKRAPITPECPGDDSSKDDKGNLIPDKYGRWFHPNKKGHAAMASFMLKNIAIQYARLRNIQGAEICLVSRDTDVPSCHGKNPNRKGLFVSWRNMDKHVKEFCESVEIPSPLYPNWEYRSTFNWETPDEFEVILKMRNSAVNWRGVEHCKESLLRLVHGCDVNRPDNPLNFKWGGRWPRGNQVYEIRPMSERNLPTRMDGRCRAWDSGAFHSFKVEGHGWARDDYGRELWWQIKQCAGTACGYWRFGYYDKDEHPQGWEWWATFTCPKNRFDECWRDQAVAKAVGGYTHKLRKNPADERYEEVGCTRDKKY